MPPSSLPAPPAVTMTSPAGSGPVFSLVDVVAGQCVEVVAVSGDDGLAERLVASGMWPGAEVEWIARAPFGDPLLYRLHGFRLALRRSEAARVQVRLCEARS
ncbi:MAG: ferrous iron transport protein A [Planctomycetota bacterium]